jgi:hypothetical protein
MDIFAVAVLPIAKSTRKETLKVYTVTLDKINTTLGIKDLEE